jgi:heme A synthase
VTQATFVRFAWVTLVLTVFVIIWGAVVRATGSGAGCGSHWPLCDGVVVPLAPRTSTMIEYTHRLSSGVVMLLSLAMLVFSRRVFPAAHRARTWAAWTFVFMLIEAAVGAGLVLLGLVEDNASALRAGYISVHLTNTMLLLGAMTGTIWWSSGSALVRPVVIPRSRRLTLVLVFMMVVAATGAVVALGDTLFPTTSLAQGLAADMDATSHVLIRLRVVHPSLAVALALVTIALARRDSSFGGSNRESLTPVVITLVGLQIGLGIINVVMLAPLPMQLAHLMGSNVLWIALVWAWVRGASA